MSTQQWVLLFYKNKVAGGVKMSEVSKETCESKHEAIKDKERVTENRLNAHAEEIGDIKSAVLKLTIMVDNIGKKSIFDKMLIAAVFIIAVVLLGVMLGPEISGKFVKGVIEK